MKAFFRTRWDYTGLARAINPHVRANERWSWRVSTAGLLAHAIREHGWSFIPNQVLPPLLANVTVGAILYTSYLQTLGMVYEPASRQSKRVFPPAPVSATATAGFIAGGVQSVVAAPLDALQARFQTNELLDGQYRNMWAYARHKLAEIGPRGVLAGWSLSFVKDSVGGLLLVITRCGRETRADEEPQDLRRSSRPLKQSSRRPITSSCEGGMVITGPCSATWCTFSPIVQKSENRL